MKRYLIFLFIFIPIYPKADKGASNEVRLEMKLDKLNRDLDTLEQLIKLDEIP